MIARITVRDVARYADVSPQTVSNVLNRRGKYGDEARQRVLDAVEMLGYRPSSAARMLRSSSTHRLAYHVLPDQLQALNPLIVDFLSALVDAAQARAYTITVFTTGQDVLGDFRDAITADIADAFILSDCDRDDIRARYLAEHHVPFAAFGRTADDLPQSWVDIDNVSAAAAAVDHLVGLGHRQIGFIGRADERYWSRDRLAGYLKGLTDNRLPVDEATIARVGSDRVLDTVNLFLHTTPPPTAILADSDVLAAATVNALRTLGLKQGSDIDVASFDGGLIEHISEPPAASVHFPASTIATKLVQRCLDEIARTADLRPGELVATTITSHPADRSGTVSSASGRRRSP